MIWLVSFPRSGNTFCRNVFFHCYGLDSQPFFLGKEKMNAIDPSVPITKTHHYPNEVPLKEGDVVLYLLRDGRDSMVSMAHQMVNLTEPGSKFHRNINLMLLNNGTEYFGGWGAHVQAWKKHATITIYFQDLITDPINEIEKLRKFVDLPIPDKDKIPTFESQRQGHHRFPKDSKKSNLFFHSGKTGGWRKKMNKIQLAVFYKKYEHTLLEFEFEKKIPLFAKMLNLRSLLKIRNKLEEFWYGEQRKTK